MTDARTGLDDVDVVFLVHAESPQMLARHHAAVAAATGPGWRGRALLVENGAAPGTSAAARAELRTRYPAADRRLLSSPRNLGFARAMDLAVDACRGRYVALLNSDGEPEPEMLRRLAEVLDAEPRAVWAAPAVHGPGEDDDPPGPPRPAEELGGTALLLRRAEFLAAGGFDPAYFFYNEDRDASRRLRAGGSLLLRVPDTRFRHGKEGRTARGVFLREWHHARTIQVLLPQHARPPGPGDRSRSSPAGRAPSARTCATATCPGPPASPSPRSSCPAGSCSPPPAGAGPGTAPGWPRGWTAPGSRSGSSSRCCAARWRCR